MKRRLLIPLDGMPLAETAIPLGRVLAEALDADIEMLRVVPPAPDASADSDARAQAYLDRIASSQHGPPPDMTTRLLHGYPGQCIVQEAGAQHVACVVMTTHARSGMRRAVLGSVAEHVVAHSPAPTALTRRDVIAPPSVRTLLVAIDATCAAPMSGMMEFAHNHDVRVVLLRVVEPRDLSVWQWQPGSTLEKPQMVMTAQEELEDVAAVLRERGTRADAHVIIGSPVAVIDAFAARIGADLIVMASHARTGAQRTLQGSVTDAVMRTASRPVLVYRRVPPPPDRPSALAVSRAVRNLP